MKIRLTLQSKLILSYLTVALITVLLVSLLIRVTSGRSLMNLVMDQQTAQLTDAVKSYYSSNGSLDGFSEYYMRTEDSSSNTNRPDTPGQPPDYQEPRGVQGLVDSDYRALLPTLGYKIGETVPADMVKHATEIAVDGQTIAWILPDTSHAFTLSPEEQLFLDRSTLAIGLAALAGVLAAVAMGFLLSGRLLKPIRRLTVASQALAQGDLQQQVPVMSTDELGQLTATFNQMSADLARVDQQRKRMTADITHDLSTPLQIISGYIEILENGDVPLTPQRVEIIKTEIEHLRRLVSDLTTLTQIEGGSLDILLEPVQVSALMERIYYAYQPIADRQNVALVLDVLPSSPSIFADEGRMLQVLKNLVDNALRYTPQGGQITLGVSNGDQVRLRVSDNGLGIDAEDLPFVFDRFYRADKSRGGSPGKMGLGLAICKALVTAQGGTISVESAGKGQGTTFVVTFAPLKR